MKNYLTPLLLQKETVSELKGIETELKYKSLVLEETNTETIIFVPSERCNLHCKYCYEVSKNSLRIKMNSTDKIVIWYTSES